MHDIKRITINYKEFYENSPDMLLSVNKEGVVVSCNNTLLQVLGYSEEEVIGEKLLDFYSDSSKVKAKENFDSMVQGGVVLNKELVVLKKNHELIDVTLKFNQIIDDNGEVLYSNAVWSDITELTKVQNELIIKDSKLEKTNQLLLKQEEKVSSAITYASYIQSAILPETHVFQKDFNDFFVLYKPKDVVSGDFYWYYKCGRGVSYVAVADCTGHGVPGAMLSMLAYGALNLAVQQFKLTSTGEILEKVNKVLCNGFHGTKIRNLSNGMDIALVTIDHSINKIQFSGAKNSLYFLNKEELNVIKSDRVSIGWDPDVSYKSIDVGFEARDRIFLTSDGYADQFGGEFNKKIGYKQMRKLFDNKEKKLSDQKEELTQFFDDWKLKGNEDQVDDVCVLGLEL